MTMISKTEQTAGEARSTVAVNDDDVQAGYNDVSASLNAAGGFLSFPATASMGSLKLFASNQGGNYASTITNAAFGQATALTIPDPGAASASFLLNSGSQSFSASSQLNFGKANGTEASNVVTASAQAGVITTSSLTTAGGSSYVITWTNTHITASSVIMLSNMGGTNTTEGFSYSVVPGAGTATLTIYNNTSATALNGTIKLGFFVA